MTTAPSRQVSVDAYRGLVMLLMLAEVLRSCIVSAAVPASNALALICEGQSHVPWVGASPHDLIQPSFYFLVGIGLFFSRSRRVAAGETGASLWRRALLRSAALVFLGMALLALHPRVWTWTFVDTLSQIGLAYPFVFLLASRPRRDWLVALVCILVGYWLLFALYPLPGAGFDYAAVGVPAEWLRDNGLSGFTAHWQKNSNAAWAFDRWFMNVFPRSDVYVAAENGLTTLNFIPSIGTMILGLVAGSVLAERRSLRDQVPALCVIGVVLSALGLALGIAGICPVVKAIWTPSWVLFSGGLCFLILAAFCGLADGLGMQRALFPLAVIGMNSLVAYCLSHLYPALAYNSLHLVFGSRLFNAFGTTYEPIVYGLAVLAVYWLILYALYWRRIFIRL